MLYLVPANKDEIDLNKNQKLEYVYPNDLEVIYLLDNNNYLSRTKISGNSKDERYSGKGNDPFYSKMRSNSKPQRACIIFCNCCNCAISNRGI